MQSRKRKRNSQPRSIGCFPAIRAAPDNIRYHAQIYTFTNSLSMKETEESFEKKNINRLQF